MTQTTTTKTSAVPEGTPAMNAMTGAVNALFSFKPFFKFASGQARKMIIERGTEIGYPWGPELARLREYDWDSELKAVQNLDIEYPEVRLPSISSFPLCLGLWDLASGFLRRADRYYCSVQYYLKPFHAYDNGNLSWDAALEVELAAKSVHANVFDPEASESEFLNDVS